MNPDQTSQPEAEEMVNLNAEDLDAQQLDEQDLEDASGGGCGNNSCWIYSEN